MKAIQVNKNGDSSVLELTNLPVPPLGNDEALVRQKACGINFIDIYMRNGIRPYAPKLPYIPGLEGAGIVEQVGSNVSDVKPGDRVAYTNTLGSYAEYNVIKADQLIPLTPEISFEQGAAFPLQGITAQYLLHEFYKIKPNDTILVHAAAGGVGLLLVQWIKKLGAKVIGTVSNHEKAKYVKEAGADHVILYSEQDFVAESIELTQGKGVDYIIDGVGKSTFTRDLDAVRVRGHICIYGSASGPAEPLVPNALQSKSITISGGSIFNFMNSREELLKRAQDVILGVREGWLKLNIETYPLEKGPLAHSSLENRKSTGKIVLTI